MISSQLVMSISSKDASGSMLKIVVDIRFDKWPVMAAIMGICVVKAVVNLVLMIILMRCIN